MKNAFTIAIDGPAAAGKGTIARALSEKFGISYLDTGLLYRAVGAKMLAGLDPVDAAKSLSEADFADDKSLRTNDIAKAASQVATMRDVRAALLEFQKTFAKREGGAILDGRDIGTVICPDAQVKLFITASDEARAQRRFEEFQKKQSGLSFDKVLSDIQARDRQDAQRDSAPMKQAEDALLLDTTNLSIEAAIAKAADYVQEALNQA